MRLLELTEPLFQYVCTLKKLSNSRERLDTIRIKADLLKIFADMQKAAETSSLLATEYEKIKLPLIFFADYIVFESNLNFTQPWEPLALEYKELAGEEKFFLILSQDISDKSEIATERLAVYYTCLSLGIKNAYIGDKEQLNLLLSRVFLRVSEKFKLEKDLRITPQAYENVDKRDFTEELAPKFGSIGIALAGVLILWFVCFVLLFIWSSRDIKKYTDIIIHPDSYKLEMENGNVR